MSHQNHHTTNITPVIFFARHGQSEANLSSFLAGSTDIPLTEEGIQQAHELAKNVLASGIQIDRIISSSLSRALDTAKIVASTLNIDHNNIDVLPSLIEKSGGNYEGGPVSTYLNANDQEVVDAGGESLEDLAERVKSSNEQISQLINSGGNTLIIGHSEFYRMAIALSLGLSPSAMPEIKRPENGQLKSYPLVSQKDSIVNFFKTTVALGQTG